MESMFVPSSEISALLSQLTSSRLNLDPSEGLNGDPERFYSAVLKADVLGLSEDPAVVRRLRILGSRGVSMAMSSASSLDRMASVLPSGGVVWSRPPRGHPDHPRSAEGGTGRPSPEGRRSTP